MGDDIDFDLFVQSGTKYVCYLASILVGLRYSWRYRKASSADMRKLGLFPKIVCTNVVWTEDQSRPFARRDAALAFELLHCEPVIGATVFAQTVKDNPWLAEFFPQLFERPTSDQVNRQDSGLGILLRALGRRPVALRILEKTCRIVSWLIYSFVRSIWARDPGIRARNEFLRRVKYPYEVFQD